MIVLALLGSSLGGCSVLSDIGLGPKREIAAPVHAESRASDWSGIGLSPGDRTIQATTVGKGPQRVYVIGSVHGDEPEALPVASALPALLRGLGVGDQATFRIVRDMNPDGSAARTRVNSRGVDLNRNWPASNYSKGGGHGADSLSELESRHVWADLNHFEPDLVVVLHSSHRGPFVNYDGPAATLASAFAAAARRSDPRWRVVTQMGYETPGSLGTLFGVDRSVPVLTIELQRGRDAGTNSQAVARGVAATVGPVLTSALNASLAARKPAAATRRALGTE